MRLVRKAVGRAAAWSQRRARRVHEAHGLILMYHRIAQASVDPWGLCVSPANFDAQMRALRESCDVVPLVRLRNELRKGRRSRPVAAVTFDDGYRDNLTVARPFLERHGIPATVFVITGYTGRAGGFWWDRLAVAILGSGTLPTRIALQIGSTRFNREDAALARRGRVGAAARRQLHARLWGWVVDLSDSERCAAIEAIEQWVGASAVTDPSRCPMNQDELLQLVRDGLIEIGAHTATHPRLSHLSAADKREQICRSRDDLARVLGRAPQCFSYPNGDYDRESTELVRMAGFELACGSRRDLVWASADAHALPRIAASDETGRAFARRLGWDVLA